MIKLLTIGMLIGLLLGVSVGVPLGMATDKPITATQINKVIVEQNCNISECQDIIQQAYYDVNYAKHCLENPENIECMR